MTAVSVEAADIDALRAVDLPRHRWYFVKEAFGPGLVKAALDATDVTSGDVVVDPFAGSGTVPLCCTSNGVPSVGVEVNPFLAAVGRTKMVQVKAETVTHHAGKVFKGVMRGGLSPLESFSTFSEDGNKGKWLFNRTVLRAFEGGWRATVGMYRPAREILRLALVGAAMDVCNAVKDGKCLRYRKNWAKLGFDRVSFRERLEVRVGHICEDLESARLLGPVGTIIRGDARSDVVSGLSAKRFKLCVTSPPYLNSFDYTDVYRPELFLGKFVQSMVELRALRLTTIRSHTQVKWEDPVETEFGRHFAPVFEEIQDQEQSLWNRRIPKMIRAYFEDIQRVLNQLKRVAAPEASVWLVVSTSAYVGVEIPVDLIIADVAQREGWEVREIRTIRHLRRVPVQQWKQLEERSIRQKPHLRESVVILDKTTKR